MARKTRAQKERRRLDSGAPLSTSVTEGATPESAERDQAMAVPRRRLERVNAPAPRSVARPAATFDALDPGDAAIPFSRMPYVPRDLRRVGMTAALMLVVILIAWRVVEATVH